MDSGGALGNDGASADDRARLHVAEAGERRTRRARGPRRRRRRHRTRPVRWARSGFRASHPKARSRARTTPAFFATPPTSPTSGTIARPFVMELRKLRATASHRPLRISSGVKPLCWAWIMSLLAKTEQRPAICAAAFRSQRDRPEVLDAEPETAGLLVQERPGAGGAVAVGAVVGDPEPTVAAVALEAHVLRVLAADLEQRQHARQQELDRPGEGPELVRRLEAQLFFEDPGARARPHDGPDGGAVDQAEDALEHLARLDLRAPGDAGVRSDREPAWPTVPIPDHAQRWESVPGGEALEQGGILGLRREERRLDADRPDVDADANRHGRSGALEPNERFESIPDWPFEAGRTC